VWSNGSHKAFDAASATSSRAASSRPTLPVLAASLHICAALILDKAAIPLHLSLSVCISVRIFSVCLSLCLYISKGSEGILNVCQRGFLANFSKDVWHDMTDWCMTHEMTD